MLRKLRYEVGRRRPRTYPPYRRELLLLFRAFIQETIGSAPGEAEFLAIAERHLGLNGDTKQGAVYLNDLWDLFKPGWQADQLAEFYKATELARTLRAIDYASDETFVDSLYAAPYRYAHERLGFLDVLEVGPAIPHGLIRLTGEHPDAVASVTINEIDAPYTRFTLWLCERRGIPADWIPARPGAASAMPERRFNFVYAKDVLEHLYDPAGMLASILAATRPPAFVAVDLADMGARVSEHVSPNLLPLKPLLDGWTLGPLFGGVLQIYER